MRQQVWNYLKSAGRPLSAARILRDVLKIHSPNALAADRVLKGILQDDPRFHNSKGRWCLAEARGSTETGNPAALFIKEFPRGAAGVLGGALHPGEGPRGMLFHLSEPPTPAERKVLRRMRSRLEGRLLVVWKRKELQLWNRLLRSLGLPGWDGESILISTLAARVFNSAQPPADLAARLELSAPYDEEPLAMAGHYAECWQALLAHVPAEHGSSIEDLRRWILSGRWKPDFSRFAFGPQFLRQLPEAPGVYIMRNRASDIIYVGKSNNLKRRIRSYFTPRSLEQDKVARIHDQLYDLEIVPTDTEVEALWTETRFIRDFRPPLNSQTEIHERARRYGRDLNLILLARESEQERISLYFLREGVFRGRLVHRPGRRLTKKLRDKVRDLYFRKRQQRKRTEEDIRETEIITRWFSRRKRRLNFVDVGDAGSYQSVLRLLRDYLDDPEKLAKKVFYR